MAAEAPAVEVKATHVASPYECSHERLVAGRKIVVEVNGVTITGILTSTEPDELTEFVSNSVDALTVQVLFVGQDSHRMMWLYQNYETMSWLYFRDGISQPLTELRFTMSPA